MNRRLFINKYVRVLDRLKPDEDSHDQSELSSSELDMSTSSSIEVVLLLGGIAISATSTNVSMVAFLGELLGAGDDLVKFFRFLLVGL